MKDFKVKMGLPRLERYSRVVTDRDFWSSWPVNHADVYKSCIDGLKLRDMALKLGFTDLLTLQKAVKDLTQGAKIGCEGKYRKPQPQLCHSL